MAGNGVNLGVGIDLAQFQKDISYVNKELKDISKLEVVAKMKIGLPKGKLKKEVEEAQKELDMALKSLKTIKRNGTPIELFNMKDIEKEVKRLGGELKKATAAGNKYMENRISSEIAKLNNVVIAAGKMSDVMSKTGLASTPKASAISKSERAELDRQIKQLEKKRALLNQDISLPSKDRLNEERKIIHQIIGLLERREATYKSGSSKAGQERLSQLRQESNMLKQQGSLFGSLGMFAARYFSLYSAWNVVKQIFDVTKELQRQKVALEGIVGSAAEATKAMNGLKAMALKSPFNLKELIGYTKQLSAYGIQVEELLPTTSKLADLSAGLGVDMSRLILAYGQVNAASVLRGQELRQFTEAGVPMVEKLAKKFSDLNGRLVTTGEVFDMISKRQVSFEMVSQVLSDMTSEGGEFYKMQENLTGTLYGQFEKLKDTWTISLKGMGDEMESIFRAALDIAMSLSKNLKGAIWAAMLAGVAKALKPISTYLNTAAMSAKGFMLRLMAAHRAGIKLSFVMKSLSKALASNVAIAALSIIVGLIINAVRRSKEWEREINKINESFAKDTAKLTVGFDKLVNKISSASENTKEFADAISTLKSNYGDFVNDNIIQALIDEARAAKEAGNEYRALAESIKASIEAKKEYERHETLKSTAAEQIMGKLNVGRIFEEALSNIHKAFSMRSDEILNGRDLTPKTVQEIENDEQAQKLSEAAAKLKSADLESAVSQAIAQMTSSNETTIDELTSRLEKALKDYGFNEIAIQHVLENADELFGKIEGTDQWKTYLSEVRVLSNNVATKIQEAFKSVNKELSGERYRSLVGNRSGGDYNPLAIDKEEQRLYIEKYTSLLESLLSPEQFNKLAADKGYQAALEISDEDYGKGKALREAIFEYQKTLVSPRKEGETEDDYKKRKKVEQEAYNTIQEVSNAFLEFAGTIGETADGIRSNGARWEGFDRLEKPLTASEKDYIANTYLKVTEENVEERQKALWAELDRLNESIATNEGNTQFKEKVDDDKRRRDVLTILTDPTLYYGAKKEEKQKVTNDKYERARFTNFFDELMSLLKKAEDATNKITGVTGTTTQLGTFVSNQLGDDNFLRGFFEEGGNPFKSFLDKLEEYEIKDFLPEINEDSLKAIFKSVGYEEGKEMSIPDFRAMMENVLKVLAEQVLKSLREKRDALPKGKDRDDLNRIIEQLQEHQLKGLEGLQERWDSEEIEKQIDKAIREISNIGKNLESIKTQNSLYERISKASNPLEANKAIYGGAGLRGRFDEVGISKSHLQSILAETVGGKAISKTKSGEALSRLLDGNLNISNLTLLLEIIKGLNKEVDKNQFKDVMPQVTGIIDGMVESIIKEYEKLAKYKTPELQISDTLVSIVNEFIEAKDAIEKNFEKGTDRYNEMMLGATQKLYNEALKSLGGGEVSPWAMSLYGKKSGIGGVSDAGHYMDQIFGGNDLLQMLIKGKARDTDLFSSIDNITAKYNEGGFGELGSKEAMEKMNAAFGEATAELTSFASGLSGSISMVDAIIKAVGQAINAAVDMGKGILNVLEKTDNRLNLRKGADGKLYDEDGNINIGDEYYEKQNSREIANQALDTISHFNTHVMSGWDKLKSGDILGALTETVMSIADLVGDITGTGDAKKEHQQEELARSNDRLARSMESLEHALKSAVGGEKFDLWTEEISKLREKISNSEKSLDIENSKKNGDDEKAQDLADGIKNDARQIDDLINGIKQEVFGATDQISGQFTDAMVSAFRNGENAARAWRNAVKGYVGDIIKEMVLNKMIAIPMEQMLKNFLGGATTYEELRKKFMNGDNVENLITNLNEFGTQMIDIINSLPPEVKDALTFNGSSSSMSGGISGITEDTARALEGLQNSQLMQLIQINNILSTYLVRMADYTPYMTTINSHLSTLDSNVAMILSHIDSLRNTPSLPLHVTIV